MTNAVQLQNYLDESLIELKLCVSSPKKLLQELAAILARALTDEKEKVIYHCLLEREKIGNTGIGNGIALPHCRCALSDKAILAVVTLDQAIDYDSADKQPVDLVFALLVPEEATDEHLKILSTIAKNMSIETNKQRLLAAKTPQQVMATIAEWSTQNPNAA